MRSRKRFSISKQAGALISSRLIPPTVGSSISVFTHDPRLLGGAKDFGLYLPREKAVEIRAWKEEVIE